MRQGCNAEKDKSTQTDPFFGGEVGRYQQPNLMVAAEIYVGLFANSHLLRRNSAFFIFMIPLLSHTVIQPFASRRICPLYLGGLAQCP